MHNNLSQLKVKFNEKPASVQGITKLICKIKSQTYKIKISVQ